MRNKTLCCYSKKKEKIWLKFHPAMLAQGQWFDSADTLLVYETDYSALLMQYFKRLYPLTDPSTKQQLCAFDVCFVNWIGKDDWNKFIRLIENDMPDLDQEEKDTFYIPLIEWLSVKLELYDLVVVEGNQ